jgi:uncharacterized protein
MSQRQAELLTILNQVDWGTPTGPKSTLWLELAVMSLNLPTTVSNFLAERAKQKFTARQIAEWIFKTFPSECQEKKAHSVFIKTDADLVQQLVAEISSQRPTLQKKYNQLKTTEGRPRQYYWTEQSEQAEISVAENLGASVHAGPDAVSLK